MYITTTQLAQFTEHVRDANDTLATLFCGFACDVVNEYIGYNPEQSERTVSRIGDGTNQLSLDVMPITTITSVTIDGELVDVSNFSTNKQYLYYVGKGNVFKKDSVITVVFTAGYVSGSVPSALQMTALRIAGTIEAESNGNVGVQSKSFGDSGSRVFLNQKFDRYLESVDQYRIIKL